MNRPKNVSEAKGDVLKWLEKIGMMRELTPAGR